MPIERTDIIDQAIGWHVRLADADDQAWRDFILWLEADPAHAAAYDTIAADDRRIDAAQFPAAVTPAAANDRGPARRTGLWLTGGALAVASAVAALIVPGMMTPPASRIIATAAGERRTVALNDGTSIEMSGSTRLRIDGGDARTATLDRGEALFHVRHDAARPFTMTAAGVTIRDLGTVFNVASDGAALSLAVSEGSVQVSAQGVATRLGAGEAWSLDRRDGSAVQSRIAPDAVGGWRDGRLDFDGQPLGAVARRLHRLYGFDLALEDGLRDRPFTGMVDFTGKADRDIPHLAELIGASWRRDHDRWILSGAPPVPR